MTVPRSLSSPETALLAVALPVVFLHVELQPTVTLPLGGDGAEVALSDVAVVALGAAALRAGRRLGFARLTAARSVLVASGALLAFIALGTVTPVVLGRDYGFVDHAFTALKFVEYVVLALSIPLLVRTRADLRFLVAVVVSWTALASAVAVLQFVGVVPEFEGYRPGQRQPSFLGHHDFAALAGATTAVALAWIALGPLGLAPAFLWAATASGIVGVVLSGALAGLVGVVAAALAAALVAGRHRLLTLAKAGALAAVVGVTAAGVLSLRAANIESFLRFIGVETAREDEDFGGESYVQRLALGYIGVRTVADHPVLGVGWQATSEEWTYAPYLDDTRRRYPKLPEEALPSPEHPWGVQNAYLQAAAELGVAGALAFLAALLVPLAVTWRAAARGDPRDAILPMLWLLVTMSIWLALGIVAGIPVTAFMWLSVGLATTAAARLRDA